MVTIIFIVSCILALVFLRKKRDIDNRGEKKRIVYYFYKNSLEFLIPLVVVILFYLILSLAVSEASEFASLQFLMQLEESFTKIKSYYSVFKLDPIKVLVILTVIYLLGIIGLPRKRSKEISNKLDRYQLRARRIYIILVLLCSFTLFGSQLGDPTENLKVRIKTIRDGYADLCKEAQEAITEEVATRLYVKVHDSFPQIYHETLALPAKIEEQIAPLRERYVSAKTEHGIKIKSLETTLDRVSSRIKAVADLKAEVKPTDKAKDKKIKFVDPDPRQINYYKIRGARTAISQFRNRLRLKAITLLRIEGAKKVASQFPTVFTKYIQTALRPLTQAYPILEPAFDVFSSTIDKRIEIAAQEAFERVINSVIQNPKNVDKVIDQEASKIVDKRTTKISRTALRKATRARKQLEKELASIEKADLQIERAIKQSENRRIVRLISELSNSNQEVRIEAAEQLSRIGEKLSKSQVNKIINKMRYGKASWSKFLYRESHCRWFEDTSVKYYAGHALGNMKSQYVSNEISKEARNAKNNGKTRRRVTDPGWI